ncbi:hypothetical protein TNCT_153331 [Trichonephila clavata]|uniref:Uncharacterized protein n=1 Tax=Trichonephila clavata TaxID=2740835 RepID=A0A8X6JJ00_TRICU|nr:hypothetical protein TNCT_153331 [Trichonephila clavata]
MKLQTDRQINFNLIWREVLCYQLLTRMGKSFGIGFVEDSSTDIILGSDGFALVPLGGEEKGNTPGDEVEK